MSGHLADLGKCGKLGKMPKNNRGIVPLFRAGATQIPQPIVPLNDVIEDWHFLFSIPIVLRNNTPLFVCSHACMIPLFLEQYPYCFGASSQLPQLCPSVRTLLLLAYKNLALAKSFDLSQHVLTVQAEMSLYF